MTIEWQEKDGIEINPNAIVGRATPEQWRNVNRKAMLDVYNDIDQTDEYTITVEKWMGRIDPKDNTNDDINYCIDLNGSTISSFYLLKILEEIIDEKILIKSGRRPYKRQLDKEITFKYRYKDGGDYPIIVVGDQYEYMLAPVIE